MGIGDFKARLGAEEFRILLRFQKSFSVRNKLDILEKLFAIGDISEEEYKQKLNKLLATEGGIEE